MREVHAMFSSSFMKKALYTTLTGLFLAASGCGGGGGGSSTLSFTGNTDPAVITQNNAAPLVASVFLGSSASGTITVQGISAVGSSEGVPVGTNLPRVTRYLAGAVLQIMGSDKGAPISIASIPIDETEPCGSGSMRLHGTLNDDFTGTVAFDFDRCRDGDVAIDGAGTLRIDSFDMNRSAIIDGTMTFSLLTFSAPGSDFSMSGSMRLQSTFATDTETLTSNLVIKDNDSSAMWETQNFVIRTRYDSIFMPSNYSESWSGRFYDSVLGYVDIATNQPMFFSNIFIEYPDGGGELVLNGAGDTSIRVSMLSGTQVMLELDLDGDSSYELSATVLWTVLEAGGSVTFV